MIQCLSRLFCLAFLAGTVDCIGNSIEDCQLIASLFDNTCYSNTEPIDFISHRGKTVSCEGYQRCPDEEDLKTYTSQQPCTWQRKLCVTCYTEEDPSSRLPKVFMRVQSNSLPNHCFYSHDFNPVATETDWTVEFNQNVQGVDNYPYRQTTFNQSLGIQGCGSEDSELPSKKRYVLVIGIDGMRPDALMAANTPAIDRLLEGGLSTMEATIQRGGRARSGPGWHSFMTGVETFKHGVTSNSNVEQDRNRDYKTFLWYARNEYGVKTMTTYSYHKDWFIKALIEKDGVEKWEQQTEEESAVMLENDLVNEDYQLIFYQFKNVDLTGHRSGFSKENPEYIQNIERADGQILRVLDAIERRPSRNEEEWMVALSSDHGGFKKTHGDWGEPDEKIFFALSGDRIRKGHIASDCNKPVSHMDIFPSVFDYLRLPVREEWSIDGKSRVEWSEPPASQSEQCDLTKTKPVITLSGAYMFNQLDQSLPLNEPLSKRLDECSSETTSFGRFHYETISGCLRGRSDSTAPKMCSQNPQCQSDITQFALSKGFQDKKNHGGVIGVARDGHLVYGPYNSGGDLRSCHQHDVCNGFFMDNGSYAYATTENGSAQCWGPATNPNSCNEQNCIFYSQLEEDIIVWNWKWTIVVCAATFALFAAVVISIICCLKHRRTN